MREDGSATEVRPGVDLRPGPGAKRGGSRRHAWWRAGRGAVLIGGVLALSGCGLFTSEPEEPSPPPAEPAPERRPEARPDTVVPPPPDTARPERPPVRREPERKPSVKPPPVADEPEEEPVPRRPVRKAGSPVPVLPGAIIPRQRIVAFYGHAGSTRMGILGELPPEQMLARLDEEVRKWERADPATPVRPALHVIATMAAGDPGPDSLYRLRMPAVLIERVLDWAETRDALVFLDIQPGRSDVADELPRLERWLKLPNVHLALDPEWNMPAGAIPGKQIGSMRAEEVNVAVEFLAELVEEHGLPPKVLVVHRFTNHMLPNPEDIEVDPRVQVVVNMDGWGPPAQKLNTYRSIVAPQIEQWAGFKLFYKNDRWNGNRMLRPDEILALSPVPIYIQYQ